MVQVIVSQPMICILVVHRKLKSVYEEKLYEEKKSYPQVLFQANKC